MLHRSRDASRPVLQVRPVPLLRAVCKSQLQHAAERNLLPHHAVMASGSHDLVSPPARRHLHGKHVLRALPLLQRLRNIISISEFRLLIMGKARLEDLLAHRLPVDIELIHAQARGHPLCGHYLPLVLHGPADAPRHDGGVHDGNPHGGVPRRIIQRIGHRGRPRRLVVARNDGNQGRQHSQDTDSKFHGYWF